MVDVFLRNQAVDHLFRHQGVDVFFPETVGGLLFQSFFLISFRGVPIRSRLGTKLIPVSRLAVWVQETGQLDAFKTGWFQVPGKAVWYQERLGCFMRDWVAVSWFGAGRFQERLGGFRKGWVVVSGVVSGSAVWFQERPSCFR